MKDIDIKLTNVSMKYRLHNEKVDNLKEYFIRKMNKNIGYSDFYALKNIDLEIRKGEKIGIIGHNGAGKSTLLKIISNVLKPSDGNIHVDGKVAPLLELGSGFDNELSGRDNIFLNGAIMGKSKEYLKNNEKKIIEFSGLGEFIDVAVKNYSSGMRAKLGFSIATQIEPTILIIDEVLGVGDKEFKEKSSKRMMELIEGGTTVLIVSHSIGQIRSLTEKVIWMEKGKIKEFGDTEEVCNRYEKK